MEPAADAHHPAPRVVARRVSKTTAPKPRTVVSAPSLDKAHSALSAARLMRAEYLVALTEGVITMQDIIEASLNEIGKPLRRISLRQLLLSQPGWGQRRASRFLRAVAERLEVACDPREMTIAWLTDPRAGGRRYLAWLDVTQPKNGSPWAGFPFTPRPEFGAAR